MRDKLRLSKALFRIGFWVGVVNVALSIAGILVGFNNELFIPLLIATGLLFIRGAFWQGYTLGYLYGVSRPNEVPPMTEQKSRTSMFGE